MMARLGTALPSRPPPPGGGSRAQRGWGRTHRHPPSGGMALSVFAFLAFLRVSALADTSSGFLFCSATILPADAPASLPTAWCRAHFGVDSVDPSADPDSDGLSNAEEYSLGTDPTAYDTDGDGMGDGNELYYEHDPLVPHAPPLAFTAVEPQPDGSVLLRWSTMYGLGYLPQFKDAIDVPVWSNLVRRVIWEGSSWPSGEQSVLDRDAPKHPARFYRILTVDEE